MGLLGDLMSSWEGTADRTLIALRACVCVWRVSVCVCVCLCVLAMEVCEGASK